MIHCPSCKTDEIILPSGPKTAPILFVGSKPHKDDYRSSRPFQGGYRGILKGELARQKIDVNSLRLMYAYIHEFTRPKATKTEADIKTEACYQASLVRLLEEIKGKELVVASGTEAIHMLSNGQYGVSDVAGLIFKSPYTKVPIMGFSSIGSVFRAVGEMRCCTEKLANYLIEKGLMK